MNIRQAMLKAVKKRKQWIYLPDDKRFLPIRMLVDKRGRKYIEAHIEYLWDEDNTWEELDGWVDVTALCSNKWQLAPIELKATASSTKPICRASKNR